MKSNFSLFNKEREYSRTNYGDKRKPNCSFNNYSVYTNLCVIQFYIDDAYRL